MNKYDPSEYINCIKNATFNSEKYSTFLKTEFKIDIFCLYTTNLILNFPFLKCREHWTMQIVNSHTFPKYNSTAYPCKAFSTYHTEYEYACIHREKLKGN